jgi:hypothetical protein
METTTEPTIYGLVAAFDTSEAVVSAAHQARHAGYTRMEAHSPIPVEGLAEAVGYRKNPMPAIVFIGGLLGGIGGFAMQYYLSVLEYPMNIGGRPLNSWPAFFPVTFECTVLGAALSAVFGMIGLNGLPQPYHPLFNVPAFSRASSDRFFLFIRSDDPKFDPATTSAFLGGLGAESVSEVTP